MTRLRQNRHKKHRGRRLLIGLLLILALVGVGFVCFPQLNNLMRTANGGNDTAADKAVKAALVTQLNNQKNGNATTDAAIDTAVSAIDNTKMSTIMKAAKNQADATSMLEQNGVSSTAAQVVTSAIYNTSALDNLRAKLAAGDYYGVYQAAKTTSANSSDLSSLTTQLEQALQ